MVTFQKAKDGIVGEHLSVSVVRELSASEQVHKHCSIAENDHCIIVCYATVLVYIIETELHTFNDALVKQR